MADLVFLALAIGFFAIAAAYIRACASIAKIDEGVLGAADASGGIGADAGATDAIDAAASR